MNVFIPQETQSPQTLQAGDIVVFKSGDIYLMANNVEKDGSLLTAIAMGSAVMCDTFKTGDGWIKHWSGRWGYTIYSSTEWALQLVRQ